MTATATVTHVQQIFIKTTPQQLWAAITSPEHTRRYFHGASITVAPDHLVSHGPNGDLWGDEPVYEFDPPRRLVHRWRSLYDPECANEEPSRVTWEIEEAEPGVCRLVVTHDRLEGAPRTAARVSGPGWAFVLSGLKTFLETGASLSGPAEDG